MSPIPFEPGAIRMLARLMDEEGLSEIELAEKDRRIKLVRPSVPMTVHHHASVMPALAAAGAPAAAAPPAVTTDAANHPGAILSPMVGVVYLTPEPNAPPFVTVGAPVEAGQTLLLIEAMKTFNPIVAAKGGTLSKILVESGDTVDPGQVLMIVVD
jgi:acetyl-CoA carboxylase biotin carboxyl carrier protein